MLVETAGEAADRQSKDIAENLSFLKILLLVLGFVALLVGAFLIFNTFSITVAQRIRELGMLRTLGASRRQVLGSMILEATVLGAMGSVLGVLGGIGAAKAINALFKSFGIDLPNTGTVIATRTVIVALLVGMVVTLLSAIVPAVRATRVSPMAALRDAELPDTGRHGRIYTAVASLLLIGGLALTCVGLFGGAASGTAAGLVGGGAVVTLFGVSMWSPSLVRPLASITGRPLQAIGGLSGRLARENAIRKPGRTAVTAAALMIGLAVMVFVTVFAAGLSDSIAKAVDRNFQADLVLQNIDGFSPVPAGAEQEARSVQGVQTVSSLSFSSGTVTKPQKQKLRVSAVDPHEVNQVLSLDWMKGSPDTIQNLGAHDAVVDDAWAKSEKIDVGDTISIRTPLERTSVFTVRGTVKDNADLLGNLVIPEQTLQKDFGSKAPSMIFAKLAGGSDAEGGAEGDRRQARDALSDDRGAQPAGAQGQPEGPDHAARGPAVRAAGDGRDRVDPRHHHHAGALDPRAHARARMLRAVGMSRRQIRRMVRYEAVITALIGALLGMIIGVVFAALVTSPWRTRASRSRTRSAS